IKGIAIDVEDARTGIELGRFARRRYAVVRHAVGIEVIVAERDTRRSAQSKRERRSNTELLVIHLVTPGHISFCAQYIQPESRVVVELPVAIGRAAQVTIGAVTKAAFGEGTQLCFLADQVDAAA